MPAKRIDEKIEKEICNLYKEGKTFKEIKEITGKGASTIDRVLDRNNIPRRGRDHFGRTNFGKNSPTWKGGKQITKQGYVRIRPDKNTISEIAAAMINSQGTVFEHRLVMAEHLGRPLTDKETVHHLDGDKTNNNIENLQLRGQFHGKGQVASCLDCGSNNIGMRDI